MSGRSGNPLSWDSGSVSMGRSKNWIGSRIVEAGLLRKDGKINICFANPGFASCQKGTH
jgi:hypothetical protein